MAAGQWIEHRLDQPASRVVKFTPFGPCAQSACPVQTGVATQLVDMGGEKIRGGVIVPRRHRLPGKSLAVRRRD